MPCLFALFSVFTPRLAVLFMWLARPAMFSAAFSGSWLWPLLGFIFLPFTTIMYVLLWRQGIGITGFDWFWLLLAVFCDMSHYASTAYSNRNQIPGMSQAAQTSGS